MLLGPPGAGKGTQGKALAQRLGVAHVASGDLFREHEAEGTELGRLAKSYMDRGELVPDHVTIGVVLQQIHDPDCAKGYILDGFPRTLEQAQALDKALGEWGEAIDLVLYIQVEEEELVRRLGGRLTCESCQAVYHRDHSPPKVEGRCDVCGGTVCQREDDKPEKIRQRFRVYQEQTAPLVEYYRCQGKLKEVNGDGSIQEVGQALRAAVAG